MTLQSSIWLGKSKHIFLLFLTREAVYNLSMNSQRCLSACEKDKFDVILGHGEEGETEGEILLAFTINDKFSSEEEQVRGWFTYILLLETLIQLGLK